MASQSKDQEITTPEQLFSSLGELRKNVDQMLKSLARAETRFNAELSLRMPFGTSADPKATSAIVLASEIVRLMPDAICYDQRALNAISIAYLHLRAIQGSISVMTEIYKGATAQLRKVCPVESPQTPPEEDESPQEAVH